MSTHGILQIGAFLLVLLAITKPLGVYLYRVFESETPPLPRLLGTIEGWLLRLSGATPKEQTATQYTVAIMLFSALGLLVTFLILRLQACLPLNPQHLANVGNALAFNTSASFVSNTDWQAYAGESTLSYFSQMVGLAWHNFTSAAVGIGVALAMARGFTRHHGPESSPTIGNFWVDLVRAILYVLLPLCIVVALIFVWQGAIQNFAPYHELSTLEGLKQILPMGPVASQEAIKQLGTNGGGFFNANSAHPFENPTPLSNFLQMILIFAIPAGLTYTYGKMARSSKQGWAIFAAMATIFLVGALACYAAESRPNPALAGLPLTQTAGNLEGKEVRFGIANSALFASITTDASCGAVNSMHDSFNPLGGLIPLVNIQLGEIIFGGTGAGLYGMLVFVLLTVFIAGLMVGRTPEYLGKKIEAREMKLAMLYVLIFPLLVLGGSAVAAVTSSGVSSLNNAGPHGLSEILYAFSSASGNNGSAFAGLNAGTTWWNLSLAFAMLAGRFLMMLPILGIASAMVSKKIAPAGPGTFPTDGILFTSLLIGVVIIVGALTFFPALALGPIVEHFVAHSGKVY